MMMRPGDRRAESVAIHGNSQLSNQIARLGSVETQDALYSGAIVVVRAETVVSRIPIQGSGWRLEKNKGIFRFRVFNIQSPAAKRGSQGQYKGSVEIARGNRLPAGYLQAIEWCLHLFRCFLP